MSRPGLCFGTSGIPRSSARKTTEHGIRRARELGLGCLEMGWVRGVRMGDEAAGRIARTARECGLELTAHAPYFINLGGSAEVARRSLARLLGAARLAARCGARSLCFHAGTYPRGGPRAAIERVGRMLRSVTSQLRSENVRVDLRPELAGRSRQLGTLDEILEWSAAVEGVWPCLDFAHHYARQTGAANRYQDFAGVLERVRARLGRGALERLHVHLSGIEYGPLGERRHLPLRQSRFRYREVLRALRDFEVGGWVICESPDTEEDALRLQRAYRRLGAFPPRLGRMRVGEASS